MVRWLVLMLILVGCAGNKHSDCYTPDHKGFVKRCTYRSDGSDEAKERCVEVGKEVFCKAVERRR